MTQTLFIGPAYWFPQSATQVPGAERVDKQGVQ